MFYRVSWSFLGLKIAVRPPDKNHPYGHGKAEPIAALIVGCSLIGAAIVIAFESIHCIITPHPPPAPFTLIVLGGVLVIKELLFRYVANVGDSIGSIAVKSDAWHHRSDAITLCLRRSVDCPCRRATLSSRRSLGRPRCRAGDPVQCMAPTSASDS